MESMPSEEKSNKPNDMVKNDATLVKNHKKTIKHAMVWFGKE